MARLPRLVVAGLPHVVSLQVQHAQTLARDDADRHGLLERLRESAQRHGVAIHAFGFGNDGLDLLATPGDDKALGSMIQSLARRHAAAFNKRHGRRGGLWAGRYRAAALEPQAWTLRCMRWVDARAQRASAARRDEAQVGGDWSSSPQHTGGATQRWIVDPPAYWSLGNTPFERELAYQRWMLTGVDPDEVDRIEAALRGGWFLGAEAFLRTRVGDPGRPVAPRPAGRPRLGQNKVSPI